MTPDRTPNLGRLKLWADELINNTEREQGQGHLREGEKYCCLGVAVEVAMANGLAVDASVSITGLWRYNQISDFLPDSVSEWYGISHNPAVGEEETGQGCADPACFCNTGHVSATDANDEKKWTFKEIGEGIRKFYKLDA